MSRLATAFPEQGFGATARRDSWWVEPILTVIGFSAFLIYGTWAAMQGSYFEIRANTATFTGPEVAPYLSPFYSPLIYDPESPHAWIRADRPSWIPWWIPLTPALLILPFPGVFRFTCYYYRKAYYRAFWADPPACWVGEPRKHYWGENRGPMLIQNLHRYALYFALLFLAVLTWDAILAFRWPVVQDGRVVGHTFGMGLGTLILIANVALLCAFTFGCNSLRHLIGGRMDCFSCPHNVGEVTTRFKLWRCVTWFNERHALWAWLSLFSVGFADIYVRLCAMGIWKDVRFF
jgi:hypothetical protein